MSGGYILDPDAASAPHRGTSLPLSNNSFTDSEEDFPLRPTPTASCQAIEKNTHGGYNVQYDPPEPTSITASFPKLNVIEALPAAAPNQNQAGNYLVNAEVVATLGAVATLKPNATEPPLRQSMEPSLSISGMQPGFRLSASSLAASPSVSLNNSQTVAVPPPNGGATGPGSTWMREFQTALECQNPAEKYRRLYNLARDFSHASQLYGKIIISEAFIPDEAKTIKPLRSRGDNAGSYGVAGGVKYLHKGIFFKFATDTKADSFWMYGENSRDDYKAMKVARHELKALMAVYDAGVPGLNFPLMTVITYRGFSLLAEPELRLGRSTLVYGSDDACVTVHNDNFHLDGLMRVLAARLNLKEHPVKDKILCGPFDIEGHLCSDGKFYLVDFARLFPPEYSHGIGRGVFYKLFRPEFVASYPVTPLASDVFLTALNSPANAQCNIENKQAANYLHSQTIPEFVSKAAHFEEVIRSPTGGLAKFIREMHSSGINCRHLGEVRYAFAPRSPHLRCWLLTEMVARVIKNDLNRKLRKCMEDLGVALEQPYIRCAHEFLSCVLNRTVRPNKWDASRVFGELKVSGEGSFVESVSANQNSSAGAVLTEWPLARDDESNVYFEVTLEQPANRRFLLGVVRAPAVLDLRSHLPGQRDEIVYDSESGEIEHHGRGTPYGSPLRKSDVLGLWWSSGTLRFALNGVVLREAATGLRGIYLPVLCVCPAVGKPSPVPLQISSNFGAKAFSADIFRTGLEMTKMDRFWLSEVKSRLAAEFHDGLTAEENQPTYSLLWGIDEDMLLTRLSELANVDFSARVRTDIRHPGGFQLLESDIVSLRCHVDELPIVKLAEANVLLKDVVSGSEHSNMSSACARKLLNVANDRMSASGLRNHEFFFLWGCILLEQALREPTGADVPLTLAVERFRIAIERHRRVHNQTYVAAYLKLGDCLCLIGQRAYLQLSAQSEPAMREAERAYQKALMSASSQDDKSVRSLLVQSIQTSAEILDRSDVLSIPAVFASVRAKAESLLKHDARDEETTAIYLFSCVKFIAITKSTPEIHKELFELATRLLRSQLALNTARVVSHAKVLLGSKRINEDVLAWLTVLTSIPGESWVEWSAELKTCEDFSIVNDYALRCLNPQVMAFLSTSILGVRRVEFSCGGQDRKQAEQILSILAKQKRLTRLVLSRSEVRDASLMEVFLNCPHLSVLELVECGAVSDMCLKYIGVLRNLQRLKLQSIAALSELSLKAIHQLLELRELCLAYLPNLGGGNPQNFVPIALLPKLHSLVLRHVGGGCTGEAVIELAKKLRSAEQLKQLDVRGVKFTSQQQDAVCNSVPSCSVYFDTE